MLVFAKSEAGGLGEGSGWDWKALSARRPSPTHEVSCHAQRSSGEHTNIQHQSLRRCFLCLDSMLAHAMYNRAHKVNAEDRIDVHKVKHHSDE